MNKDNVVYLEHSLDAINQINEYYNMDLKDRL